ncbi:PREDICTED: olfactory receptor 18-like [Chrysochloris asiatica]|uniref:Olfactory receptor 18-like n=1 Tax=Chrysochloris asiatica TaxID=185453 RepID=A0A9B0X3Q6_CHRAS|nr:PREDICTED: olfactory receptor 18-like [Chrysochloris asiatica]
MPMPEYVFPLVLMKKPQVSSPTRQERGAKEHTVFSQAVAGHGEKKLKPGLNAGRVTTDMGLKYFGDFHKNENQKGKAEKLEKANFAVFQQQLRYTQNKIQQLKQAMESRNVTGIAEFLLLGLSEDPEMQHQLFELFLSIYLITMCGNLLIILAVSSDPHLHNPMYFFLCNLSLADIGFVSTTVPKMLMNIQTQSQSITYLGCLTQVSFFYLFGCLDNLFLTVMAYDRLVAICHPLHYTMIMNPRLCGLLVLVSFLISILDSQLHISMVSQLTFCSDVKVPSFFCDPPQLLNLACSDTSTYAILVYFIGAILGGIPVSGILFSYIRIISSILRVSSSDGRYKAFSTCGSHLSVVCFFYGTALGSYFSSAVKSSARKGAVASVMYTIVTPMLNPFIYSLRNRDIKRALWRLLSRTN